MARPSRLGGAGPLFRQLAQSLIDAIESGAIAVGDRLPTESELMVRHRVSRQTVRQALGELRGLGLIESRRGIGSTVVRRDARQQFRETYSTIDELFAVGRSVPLKIYEVAEIIADPPLAAWLRAAPGQSYLRIAGFRHDASDPESPPAGHVEAYVDAIYGGVRDHLPTLATTLAELIDRLYGIAIARIDQEILVARVSAPIAARLGVPEGTPALSVTRWYFADSERAFEVTRTLYPIGRFVFRNSLARAPG